VLAVYGELDARVNATRDAAVGALEDAGLTHEVLTLPDADHAFFNDTGPRSNEDAATTAYDAVLDKFGSFAVFRAKPQYAPRPTRRWGPWRPYRRGWTSNLSRLRPECSRCSASS
jgi:hypothetical protein